MTSGDARDALRLAEQQSRHLDGIASMTLGISVLLASGGAAFIAAAVERRVHPLDATSIFAPLMAAFIFTLIAVGQRSLLIPDPRADSELIARRAIGVNFDREQCCLRDTIRGNRIRNVALLAARLSILVSVVNFVYWVTEDGPVEPSSLAESIFSASEAQQEAAGNMSAEDRERAVIEWCRRSFSRAPVEESAEVDRLCTSERLTVRLWIRALVGLAAMAAHSVFFVWAVANRREREASRALSLGVVIDLELKARRLPRDRLWRLLAAARRSGKRMRTGIAAVVTTGRSSQ